MITPTEKRLYLKLFLFFTITFGGCMGTFAYFGSHSISKGLASGIFAGLFYGTFMTIILGLKHHSSIKSIEPTYGESVSNVNQVRTITIKENTNRTYDLCKQALQDLKTCHITKEDRRLGHLHAQTGMTWKSFGERMMLDIAPANNNETKITISSKPKFGGTLIDYGKNAENVQLILNALKPC